MKYLRVLLLFGIALFCGSVTSHAQDDGFDFHATVLDPTCGPASECTLHPADIGVPFSVTLDAGTCSDAGVTGLPAPPFGCFLGTNATGTSITSFTLDFLSIPTITGCDTNATSTSPPVAFSVSSCVVDPAGGFDLTFSGGSIAAGHTFIILEEGVDPTLFNGMATVNPVPEPDSFLLLATGVMMTGLYLGTTRRQRLFGFIKK